MLIRFDSRIDINDVYVFTSPADPDNTVLVMTMSPASGVVSPDTFRPGARHQFLIDQEGRLAAPLGEGLGAATQGAQGRRRRR